MYKGKLQTKCFVHPDSLNCMPTIKDLGFFFDKEISVNNEKALKMLGSWFYNEISVRTSTPEEILAIADGEYRGGNLYVTTNVGNKHFLIEDIYNLDCGTDEYIIMNQSQMEKNLSNYVNHISRVEKLLEADNFTQLPFDVEWWEYGIPAREIASKFYY